MVDDIRSFEGRDAKASGRFLLRIDPGLHALLRQSAADSHLSLNDYCSLKLAAPMGGFLGNRELARAVIRAASILADDLIGVVAFGSWSRGEQASDSDLDLLIVVDERVPICRALYRKWDQDSEGVQRLDPHFVHLPCTGPGITSVWAEVALEGVVLFERGLELSRYLVRVRREILKGRIVERWTHGQRYWVEVA